MLNITKLRQLAESLREDYAAEARGHKLSKRWLQDYRKEIQEIKQYRGREILELLQNADDAGSDQVEISLDTASQQLRIVNSGPGTRFFNDGGVESIMFANMSQKKGAGMIGAKGLGFRAILNWASRITICSGNGQVDFGPELTENFWTRQLAPAMAGTDEYIEEARADGREVPLAILALPKIESLHASIDYTSITLKYNSGRRERIVKDLRDFRPESLLFLHNIKRVCINIDRDPPLCYELRKIDYVDGIERYELADKEWIVSRSSGELAIDGKTKSYETACAYCPADGGAKSYPIYSFFPTRIDFDLPCILHATLELDSSRNSLISDSNDNMAMMELLVNNIACVAEKLKTLECSWNPYRLMRPHPIIGDETYKALLFRKLNASPGCFVPLVSDRYAEAGECIYFSDALYDIIRQSPHGREIFSSMCLKKPERFMVAFDYPRSKPDEAAVDSFAAGLSNYDDLAKFIVALAQYLGNRKLRLNCHPYRDGEGRKIEGRTYINVGTDSNKVEDIPRYMKFEYMNPDLKKALEKLMSLPATIPARERDMASQLSYIGDVSSADITYVTRSLLPKMSSNNEFNESQLHDLLRCVFKLYQRRDEDFSCGDVQVYLFSEAGTWCRADSMVMADKRFPNGFRRLHLDFEYKPEQCVAYPYYLDDEDNDMSLEIQEFLSALGVNLYFTLQRKRLEEDKEYFNTLHLNDDQISGSTWKDKDREKRNQVEIADPDMVNKLRLNDLLKLLSASDYYDKVCGEQEIHWFYNKSYKSAVKHPLSYAAYKLRKESAAGLLQYYAVDEREWLPGMKPPEVEPFDSSERTEHLLYALGAAKNWGRISPGTLYQAMNSRAVKWKVSGNYSGVKTFYHKMKQALNEQHSKGPESRLSVVCRINGELQLKDSREVFYSNNIGVRSLRRKLPVLEMNLREGDEQVRTCFGCRLIKDIRPKLIKHNSNELLNGQLYEHLEMLKPYIFAHAAKDSDEATSRQSIESALAKLSIHVVRSATYSYQLDIEGLSDDVDMQPGDLIEFEGEPTVCCDADTLTDALDDPLFCNAVVEAVCIALKLNSSDNVDKYYRLLKSSQKELEFLRHNELDEALWRQGKERFGMSQSELRFWKEVFETNGFGNRYHQESLRRQKRKFIAENLDIDMQLTTQQAFKCFHKQCLQDVRRKYEPGYLRQLHGSLSGESRQMQQRYYPELKRYTDDVWLDAIVDKICLQLRPDYEAEVKRELADRFGFRADEACAEDRAVPIPHDEYLLDYDVFSLNLSDEERSLLYFDGNADYFASLIDERTGRHEAPEKPAQKGETSAEKPEAPAPSISYVGTSKPPLRISSSGGGGGKGRRNVSRQDKIRLGNEAEDIVLAALRAPDSDFEVGHIYSEYLARKEGYSGDNSKGYDLQYRRKGESLYRCLEIKYSNGSSIVVSRNEYAKSQHEYKGRYDVALVVDGQVKLWPNAFDDESSYTKSADEFTVSFNLHDIE